MLRLIFGSRALLKLRRADEAKFTGGVQAATLTLKSFVIEIAAIVTRSLLLLRPKILD